MMIVRYAVLVSLSVLSACSGRHSAEGLLEDYVSRIERVTGVERRAGTPVTRLPYPAQRNLTLPVAELRVGMLDYLKLYDCPVFNLISERNSVLGKVMPLSAKLGYEIRFLHQARACYAGLLEHPMPDRDWLEAFRQVIETKQASLASTFWNAVFASPEAQKAFSLASAPLDPGEERVYSDSLQAVKYFYGLGKQLTSAILVDTEALSQHFFTLQRYQYGGRLSNSVALLTAYLDSAAAALETTQSRSVCYRRESNQKARILHTVFTQFYVAKVGPYLAQIHAQGQAWLTAVNALISVQNIAPPAAFVDYQAQMLSLDRGLWQRFNQAIRRHTQAWQALLERCGLSPGSGARD